MMRTWPVLYGLLLSAALAAQAQFSYTTNADGISITLTGYTGTDTDLTIPDAIPDLNVTGIGSNVFFGDTNLVSVTIPGTVNSIGDFAFSGCSSLAGVAIPSNVASIGMAAFANCTVLAYAVIPEGVASLGQGAFYKCVTLSNVTIPGSITNIGGYAFQDCNHLTNATIADGVPDIGAYAFYGCDGLISVTIPASVGGIGDSAFYACPNLAGIAIPGSVAGIGDDAFSGCLSLGSVTISNGVGSIGQRAFLDCPSLASVTIPGSVAGIGPSAFYQCGGLTNATISNGVAGIGPEAFGECPNLAAVTIPGSVTGIGSNAFVDTGLTSMAIPGSVTNIGDGAFSGCASLAGVTISNGVAGLGQGVFFGCLSLTNLIIPVSVTSIGPEAFGECIALAGVAIPGSVTEMTNVFYDCPKLQSVMIDNGVTNIAAGEFNDFASLTSVTIPGSVASIGDYAFYGCSNLANVTMSNGLASIGQKAFYGCLSLTSLVIPGSVTSIGPEAFGECIALASVAIPGGVSSMTNQFYDCANLQGVMIDNGVTSIGAGEFNSFASLTSVTIPGSVTSIGAYAFYGCSNLAGVTIPGSVTSVGASAFGDCPNLASATIPGSVTSMATQFPGCTNLQSIAIDYGVTNIGASEFNGLASLTNVTIPGSVSSIGDYAFYGCSNLASVTISNGVTSIGQQAFYDCLSLTSLVIPVSVTSIGPEAFGECAALASAAIPDSVSSMTNVFYDCANLQNVTIDNGVTNIGAGEFNKFTSLASVTIPGSVSSIGDYAFYGCSNLASVTFSNGVTSIGQQAFYGCLSLTNLVIPVSVTSIGPEAFGECVALASVAIPDSVTEMTNVFYDCTNLQSVTIDNGVASIGAGEFNDFASLTSLAIAGSVTSIGEYAFYGCTNLFSVTIPASVTNIGEGAFSGCGTLTVVLFQGKEPVVGTGVFNGDADARAYHLSGATGWGATFAGLKTAVVAPPAVKTQPGSVSVVLGTNLSLSFDVSGTLPLEYQWQWDGSNLPGATNAALVILGFQTTNAGSYRVVITNNYGGTTSAVTVLTGVAAPFITSQPAGQSVVQGGNAAFQVTATGSGKLAYQWKLNGRKLADGSHVSGATTSGLTLENVTAASAGSYEVTVVNSLGSATSAGAILTVALLPSITSQPANQEPPPAGIADFRVKASGTPLAYQWFFDGAPLSDGGNISGSASNTLTVNMIASNDVGSYWVVVSNVAGSVASKAAQLTLGVEKTKPSVAIASPKADSRSTAPVLSGTASDDVRVLDVAYWVTNVNNGVITASSGLATLSAGTGASSNWSIHTALLPGTNILAVQSSNYSGLASPVEKAVFFYEVTTPFRLIVNPEGTGKVTGAASVSVPGSDAPTNGAALCIGERYTLDADAAANWWLSHWLTNSSLAGTNTKVAFIMEPNLVLTANFTNLAAAAARYDGIFYPASPQPETVTNSGLIENLLLKTNGVYSGKLYLAGTNYPLSGSFDKAGQAAETIARSAAEGGKVTLQLTIPWGSAPRQITGWVRGTNSGGWLSGNLLLCAAATNADNFAAYTALLPQDTNAADAPASYGYALITNTGSMIALGGALSDGTPFSRSEPINELNQFPVYASLYGGQGLLLGQLSLDAATGAAPAGNLIWSKPPQQTGLYAGGFYARLGVEGSPWTNSASALAAFTNGAQLTLSGGTLASNLVFTVQLTSSNTLQQTGGPANFLSGSINGVNGLLTLDFTDSGGNDIAAHGTILQNTNLGGGFFPGATNAGTILLQP